MKNRLDNITDEKNSLQNIIPKTLQQKRAIDTRVIFLNRQIELINLKPLKRIESNEPLLIDWSL